MDKEMNIIYRSPSGEKITGWTQEDLASQNVGELVHPDDLTSYREAGHQCILSPGKQIPVLSEASIRRVITSISKVCWLICSTLKM